MVRKYLSSSKLSTINKIKQKKHYHCCFLDTFAVRLSFAVLGDHLFSNTLADQLFRYPRADQRAARDIRATSLRTASAVCQVC